MKPINRGNSRFVFIAGCLALALICLTACDEADHYYVFFDKPAPGQTGPDCSVFCVKYGDGISDENQVQIHNGDTVGFFNLATGRYEPSEKTTVTVELTYKYPNGEGLIEKLRIKEGKSKRIEIKNLEIGTKIEVWYSIGSAPRHGGPEMIVQP